MNHIRPPVGIILWVRSLEIEVERLIGLKKANDDVVKKLAENRQVLRVLEENLRTQGDKVDDLTNQSQQLHRNNEYLRTSTRDLERARDRSQVNLDQLEARAQTAGDVLDSKRRELSGLENTIDDAEGKLDDAEGRLGTLQTKIKLALEHEEALRAEIQSLSDSKRRLNTTTDTLEARLVALQEQHKRISEQTAGVRRERAQLLVKVDDLAVEVEDLKIQRNTLLRVIATLQKQNEVNSTPDGLSAPSATDPTGSSEENGKLGAE